MVDLILNQQINPNTRNDNKQAPIHLAMSILSNLHQSVLPERLPQIKKKILGDKANLAQNLATKPQVPTELKLKAIIESLLMKGVNPNERDSGNWTAAHIAAKGQNVKIFHWMFSLNRELAKQGLPSFDF